MEHGGTKDGESGPPRRGAARSPTNGVPSAGVLALNFDQRPGFVGSFSSVANQVCRMHGSATSTRGASSWWHARSRATIRPVNLVDELHAIAGALRALGVPYAICGGIAVTIHGATRTT
jgi:hypothetical protein